MAIISRSNITTEVEFKEKVKEIFNFVADAISKTVGPYGQTTIIEQFGEMHVTKDGWTVAKNIRFEDNVDNNILVLLLRIASQIVNKVGDGSSSSVIAAKQLYNQFSGSDIIDMDFSSKEFCDALREIVNELVDLIREDAVVFDHETYDERKERLIYKLAMISSNGNEELSEMVSEIYAETKNPAISFQKGKYANHTMEIVNGYKSNIRLLDAIYFNSDNADRKSTSPVILMIDHRLDSVHMERLVMPALNVALTQGKELYVIAPHYDSRVLESIKHQVMMAATNKQPIPTIFCRASIVNNLERQMYQDLSFLLGAQIVTDGMMNEMLRPRAEDEEPFEFDINSYIGYVDQLTMDLSTATFSGFSNINSTMVEASIIDAKNSFKEAKERCEGMDVYAPEVFDIKRRIAQLECNMGIIYVGGTSTLEQKLMMDVMDDVVKSCENAYLHGFNIGCCLAIPKAIHKYLEKENINEKYKAIANMILRAFLGVYETIIMNKFASLDKNSEEVINRVNEIITGSMEQGLPYNLVTNEYSQDIINPTNTDIEILKATTSIVTLLITSNQYLKVIIDEERKF